MIPGLFVEAIVLVCCSVVVGRFRPEDLRHVTYALSEYLELQEGYKGPVFMLGAIFRLLLAKKNMHHILAAEKTWLW